MKDFAQRVSTLTPEQRALFESRLKKKAALVPSRVMARRPAIPKRKRQNNCVLSFDQERIWIVDRMEPGNPAYNIYTVSRLVGPLNLEALERAVNEIVRRHEILRTTFATVDGEPVMVISPELIIKLPVTDISGGAADELLKEAIEITNEVTAVPFNLETGPLLRVGIIRLGPADHVVHITMHHSITDRWSAVVLEQEMVALYSAFIDDHPSPLDPVELQFADFAEWQREYLQGEVLAGKLEYWKGQLSGAPLVLELPTDRRRPPFQKFRGAREVITLPEPLLRGLKSFTQAEGATMFMTLLAAYNLVLYRYTGQEDILIGLAMANRGLAGTEDMLGYLLNMVIIRAKFSAWTSFRALLAIVRQSAIGAFANLDLPLGSLIDELKPAADPSRNPIFQVAYIYLDFPPETGMEYLKIKPIPLEADNGSSRFDMTLALTELPDRLDAMIEYNTDLFMPETIRRMLQHLSVLLEEVVENPDRALSELRMLTAHEMDQVQSVWNDTSAEFPREQAVHQLAQLTAEGCPDTIAVVYREALLTYGVLNERANKFAHYLASLGIGAGSRAAVCLERSPDLIMVLLGILKAGGSYVPLDPGYPLERLTHILDDSECSIVISQESLIGSLPSYWGMTISIDADQQMIEAHHECAPQSVVPADSPAYVIYTSGSTGGPRGVSIPHRAIVRLVLNIRYAQLGPESVVAQCSSASFDAATFEIWGALLNGSQLVIVEKDVALNPGEFSDELRKHGISVLFLTTALFNQIARHNPRAFCSMKYLLFGGEKVTPAWVRAVVEAGKPQHLLHVYGPTENTTFSSFFNVDSADEGEAIPIGLPITNSTIHVLDRDMSPVPASVVGELFISGEGLAHCYLSRPDLTAERFMPNSAADLPGERLYSSGDLGRRRADGNIVFVGRNDFQVKVRGFRIELEEAEAGIKLHPGIDDAVILVSGGSEHERRLVAYVIPRTDYRINISELRRFVCGSLPEYMAPSAMVEMEKFPLTENGKVDRSKLPDAGQLRPDLGLEYVGPATLAENSLCEIWASVLELDRVGVRDNFFDLGGDSIRSIQIMSRSELAGHSFSIQELFQNPTVEALAAIIDARDGERESEPLIERFSMIGEDEKAAIPESVEDAYPLTMLQAGMIFHSELSPATAVYHDIFSFHLRARLDIQSMQESMAILIARHPILRTSFNLTGTAKPLQFVWSKVEMAPQFEDISSLDTGSQRELIRDFVDSERSNGFAWDRAPLLRLWIHKRTAESFQFTLSFHHAILDGWSLSCFCAELFGVYLARVNGRAEPVAHTPGSSFKHFVALEMEAVGSNDCQRFWEDRLDSALFTTIPRGGRPQTANQFRSAGVREIDFGEDLAQGLLALSRRLGVPLKSPLLAIHARVLALVNGHNDIVTGLVSNGRPEGQDADKVLGLFLNTVPLRMRLDAAESWEGLALAAFAAEKETLAYRRYPLAEIQRITGRNPLLETAFNYTHFHVAKGIVAARDIEILEQEIVSETNFPFLLDFNLDPVDNRLQGAIKYDRSLFEERNIELIGGYYARALKAMVDQPGAKHGYVPLLSRGEIDALIHDSNSTRVDYGPSELVHEMVKAQADRTPDAIALISNDLHVSYEEVNRASNRLAGSLTRIGAAPERRIGIMLDRSAGLSIGLLSVLKCGAAYVPMDASFPAARLELMLGAVDVLLTQSKYLERVAGNGIRCPVVCIDDLGETSSFEAMTAVHEPDPDNLVYVIFTSGSTGTPKGVAITHSVAANMVRWNTSVLRGSLRVLQFASPSFDVAFQEIFTTWSAGGTLVLVPEATRYDQPALAKLISDERVERSFLPNVVLQQLAEQLLSEESELAVKEVITAGEQLKVSKEVRDLLEGFKERELHNHYGPSETHAVTAYRLPRNRPWPDLPPIGKPIANARIYLMNENMEPVPCGVAGEIFIGGEVVGRGYIGRPDSTAERFICDPYWENGSRLYRTGDIGRRRPDGEIEFIGRLDSQVKVRGFRIEPGEVEAVLCGHPSVSQAIVTAFDGGRGRALVAHVVPVSPQAASLKAESCRELDEFLKARLPAYMVPADYVFLDRLPSTPTGKVDKRALPAPAGTGGTGSDYVPPATATERVVAAIWSTILARNNVGTHDNFFDLGGHSLLANQIVSRIRNALQIDLQLRVLFEHPTVAALSAFIDDQGPVSQPIALPISPKPPDSSCPLSIAQRRLWFLEQLDPENGAYHIGMALKLTGDLNSSAMEQAHTEIVRRHEVLRSLVIVDDGRPYQIVLPASSIVRVLDLTELNESEQESTTRGIISRLHSQIFNLADDQPVRSWLVKVKDNTHIMSVTMHHLVSDGWSMNIFNDEMAALYQSFVSGEPSRLSEMSLQYRDFAAWQNNWSTEGRFESDLAYWKRQLGDQITVVDLPADHARPAASTFAGGTLAYGLDPASRASLKQVADVEGATLFMAYLASILSLIYRYTGQSDLIVGVPTSGRDKPEIEGMIGFFVNTLVLKCRITGSMTVREVIRHARDVFLEAHAHQAVPFELLVDELGLERNPGRSPLFDLMFDLQAESSRATRIKNVELAPYQYDSQTSRFDMTISISDSSTDPRITIEYATALFERSSIDRLAAHFNRLVESAEQAPDAQINQLELLARSETEQLLVDFNATSRPFPEQSCIHELFDSEAARLPDSVAVVSEDHNVTYCCLSRRANAFCRLLKRRGISTESRVGICLSRSIDMIASLIAVVKAGGAYVPMDTSYPAARLDFMAADAGIELLITSSELLGNVSTGSENILCVESAGSEIEGASYEDGSGLSEERAGFPDSLAYIIYTSGTTGSPKGVGIPHSGVVRLVKSSNCAELDENQVILQHSTVSFDVATFEIWGGLLNGATLILMPEDMFSLEDLERVLERHRVTTAWLTAGLFRLMADRLTGGLDSLRQLLAGGEALPADQVNRFIDVMGPKRLINGYGPTEVTTFTCCHRFERRVDPLRAVPIGRPISNTAVYVLDESLNPVPFGVKGQIHAAGPGLARGYLNNPDLTAEKFVPEPFSQLAGERMYCTGDAGCHRSEGHIEFLGRLDSQIKLRGYRIELSEIESVLASHIGVSAAVVVIRTDKAGERRLAAYVAGRPGANLSSDELREHAQAALPEFMIPSWFVVVGEVPLTRSGKVDRSALPDPFIDVPSSEAHFEPARNAIEEGLALIWMRVLGRERIGIHDDFFSLGGHSLLATQVVSRIREAFEVDLPLRSLFENRNISRLGAKVEALLLDKLEALSEEEAAGLLG